MVREAITRRFDESEWLVPGFFLGLLFDEGYTVFRIVGAELTQIKPYVIGDVAANNVAAATFNDIRNGVAPAPGGAMLDPRSRDTIEHCIMSVNYKRARVYTNYPSRTGAIGELERDREIPGAAIPRANPERNTAYWDGEDSPVEDPDPMWTRFFTVKDCWPEFQIFNPTNDPMSQVHLHFKICKYTYVVVKDRTKIRDMVNADRRWRQWPMGGVHPMRCPDWLKSIVGADLMDYSKKVLYMEAL